MPVYDYPQKLVGLPEDWKNTGGSGVRIAIIDSGANLTLSGLAHLNISGRKFDVTQPGFDPQTATGDDFSSDFSPTCHGTQLLSILAAKSPDDSGINGFIPNAEIYVINILNSSSQITQSNLIKALQLCVRLDVDLVNNSNAPMPIPATMPDVEAAFQQMEAQNILFISHLKNTTLPNRLNQPPFPSNLAYSLAVGVAKTKMLDRMPPNFAFAEDVKFLLPALGMKVYTDDTSPNGKSVPGRSSHSTAVFTSLAALCLAKARAADPVAPRKTKSEIISEIEGISPVFSKSEMTTTTELKFFHTNFPQP